MKDTPTESPSETEAIPSAPVVPHAGNRPAGDEFDPEDPVDQLTLRQPTRRGKHRELRRFDQTQLKSTSDGRVVGRDYAAHFFRWGWVSRQGLQNHRVLDVGCGQETPLVYVMMKKHGEQPERYVGVDLNPIPHAPQFAWSTIVDRFNFVQDYRTLGKVYRYAKKSDQPTTTADELQPGYFTRGVNLEVIEHMAPPDGKVLLEGFRHWLRPDGYLYLSTPVFDGKAAVNHIHEYTIPELTKLVESCGYEVEKRWGTFANLPAIRKAARADELAVLDRLGLYYGGEVLSTFLAPLYPDVSRNNLWVLRRKP